MKSGLVIILLFLSAISGCCSKCGNCGSGDKPIVSPSGISTNSVNEVGVPVLPPLVPWWVEMGK